MLFEINRTLNFLRMVGLVGLFLVLIIINCSIRDCSITDHNRLYYNQQYSLLGKYQVVISLIIYAIIKTLIDQLIMIDFRNEPTKQRPYLSLVDSAIFQITVSIVLRWSDHLSDSFDESHVTIFTNSTATKSILLTRIIES